MSAETTQHRQANPPKVRGEWWALAIVLLAIVGFALSTPRFAGPDEEAHQATAWYTTTNGMPVKAETEAYVPSIFADGACFAFNGRQDASCVPPRETGFPELVRVLNYPPPYYWVTGIGQQVAGAVSTEAYVDVGGRAASLVLNLAVLSLIALLARRHYARWGTYLLLIVTPHGGFPMGDGQPFRLGDNRGFAVRVSLRARLVEQRRRHQHRNPLVPSTRHRHRIGAVRTRLGTRRWCGWRG